MVLNRVKELANSTSLQDNELSTSSKDMRYLMLPRVAECKTKALNSKYNNILTKHKLGLRRQQNL
jgi:hypothetical protein